MKLFLAHLRKETREHRAVLLAIAVAIPFLLAVGCAASTELAYGLPLALRWVLAGGTSLTVLALATELWAGEARRDGLALLRRTPGGIAAAFVAKTALFLAASGATAAWTAASAVGAAEVLAGAATRWETWRALSSPGVLAPSGAVVVVGVWAVLASTWVPRGAAAVGLGALLLGALLAPAVLVLDRYNWLPVLAHPIPPWAVLLVGLAIPLGATLVSLRGALDRGRGHAVAALLGVGTVMALAVPAYAWGTARFEAWRTLRPDDPALEIVTAVVGKGGRYAFLTVDRAPPDGRRDSLRSPTIRPWRVDLETGEAVEIGGLGEWVFADSRHLHAASAFATAGLVCVGSAKASFEPGPVPDALRWWDAETGTIWRTLPSTLRPPELVERLRDDLRRTTVVRTPDGRPAWLIDPRPTVSDVFRPRIEWDSPSGLAFGPLHPADLPNFRMGIWSGVRRTSESWEVFHYRPTSNGTLEETAWTPSKKSRRLLALSATAALEGPFVPPSRRGPGGDDAWVLRSAPGSPEPDRVVTSIGPDDVVRDPVGPDEVLVLRADAERPGRRVLWLVDPLRDVARPCSLPASLGEAGIASAFVAGRSPSGQAVLCVMTNRGQGLALLPPGTGAVGRWVAHTWRDLWFVSDDVVISCSGKRLFRIDWRDGTVTQVFPRG